MEREEDISPQRKPINDEIDAELIKQVKKESFTSLEAVVADAASGGKSILAGDQVNTRKQNTTN